MRRRGIVLALLALFAGCSSTPAAPDARPTPSVTSEARVTSPVDPAESSTRVRRITDAPLTHRDAPTVVRVRHEVLVLGGSRPVHCPGGLSCPFPGMRHDGAAYDLRSGTWRVIARPPPTVGRSVAVVGDRVVLSDNSADLEGSNRLFVYDSSRDSWRVVVRPAGHTLSEPLLSAANGRVYAVSETSETRTIEVLDLETGAWSTLPWPPGHPLIYQRPYATRHGVVIVGYDRTWEMRKGARSRIVALEWNGRTWRRTGAPADRGDLVWAGHRVVELAFDGERGRGQSVVLDVEKPPAVPLPARPAACQDTLYPLRLGSRIFVGTCVYDTAARHWSVLTGGPWLREGRRAVSSGAWVGHRLLVLDARSHAWLVTPPG